MGVPEGLAQDLLRLEALVEVARDQAEGGLTVVLQGDEELAELVGVDQRLGLVRPLALGQGLRDLVGDDAVQHEVVDAVGQLLAHDRAEVARHLRRRSAGAAGPQWPDHVVVEVQHRAVLHQDLADAVAVHVVVLHVLRREGLHPVDQRGLLDDVDGCVEVEASGGRGLEVAEVQVGVREAVLGAREHAGVHELVAADLPLQEHGLEVDPVEGQLGEVDLDDHFPHAVEEQPRRPEDGGDFALLGEVGELRTGEVRGLEALVALVPQMVEDEVDKVAVDAARRDREALLSLALLALGKVGPGELHLLVHAADEHRVLRARGDALEDEERCDLIALEVLELLVHEAEDAGRDAAERVGEGILQGLDRAQPEDRIHANARPAQAIELALMDKALVLQVGLEMTDAHLV
mmetsp:Transcript_1278/g.3869  ORF Transcript_1278/g.3869 Transcript_1278/m.3869 type:complete len:406 (-) Transcript_1278:71-1288(-)